MGISGNLKTMPLPDILQWLQIGNKTGTLSIEHGWIVKKIYFEVGRIVSSYSNNPLEYFGQFLLNLGKITEDQLRAAMIKQAKSGILIGKIFVDEGLVTETEVREILVFKTEETIYDLFLWTEGVFKFIDDERLEGAQIGMTLTVNKITFEGVHRVDEWKRIRGAFPSGNVVLKATDALPQEFRTEPITSKIIGLIAKRRTILEIGLETRNSEFNISKVLYDWFREGYLVIDEVREDPLRPPTSSAPPGAAEVDDEMLRAREVASLLEKARTHRGYRLFEDALKVVSRALELDPRNEGALTLRGQITDEYRDYLDGYFGKGQKVPRLNVSLQELMSNRTDFTPEEGFIVSRINGQWNVQAIVRVSPIPEFHALRIIKRLEQEKIISVS
ncbi:MAG: DUF4388 domain-containing protein [Acidobacteriota bacterium]